MDNIEAFPARVGYCKADVDENLTDAEWEEVCRQFNRADHSTLHEMLTDIADDVRSRRRQS